MRGDWVSPIYNNVYLMLYAYAILSGLLAEESLLVGEEPDERFVPLLFVTELVVDAIRYLSIVNILLE